MNSRIRAESELMGLPDQHSETERRESLVNPLGNVKVATKTPFGTFEDSFQPMEFGEQ